MNKMVKKRPYIVYIDMDDVLCLFTKAFYEKKLEEPWIEYPQSQEGFFESLEPLDGAIEALTFLMNSPHFEPYILTAPSVKNPLCYTGKRLWIGEHAGDYYVERLIITPFKNLNKGDFLIDDNNCGKGQDLFEGELLHFGCGDFKSWTDVIAYLNSFIESI